MSKLFIKLFGPLIREIVRTETRFLRQVNEDLRKVLDVKVAIDPAVMSDHQSIIVIASRIGEGHVQVIGAHFDNPREIIDLAHRLENTFQPKKPIYMDRYPPGLSERYKHERRRYE